MRLVPWLLPLLSLLTGCLDPKAEALGVDLDGDGYGEADCDDSSSAVSPGADELCDGVDNDCDGATDEDPADGELWYADADADGYGDAAQAATACSAPAGHVADATDCDDGDAATRPGGQEVCGGADEDCDGAVDDADLDVDPTTFTSGYADADGDGAGDPESPVAACALEGSVVTGEDCDDTRADVWPGATEACDEVDQDCDGAVDEDAADAPPWYADADGDGAGDPASAAAACAQPDGFVNDATDCDDTRADVLPGAAETCDGADQDCDGLVDEEAMDAPTWYEDADGDGVGDAGSVVTACDPPAGHVADATDCDDTDATISPSATEECDALDRDEDCDGLADDADASVDGGTFATWYADADADGYGDATTIASACAAPIGYVADATDCDDARSGSYPAAAEVAYDGLDQDCDGADLTDADGDGFVAFEAGGDDCDDTAVGAFPGGVEVDGDGLDNDCDGQADPLAETWTVGSDTTEVLAIAVTGSVDLSTAAPGGVVELVGGAGGSGEVDADSRFLVRMNASSTGVLRALDGDGNTVGLRIVAKGDALAAPTDLVVDTEETLWALLLLSPGWATSDPYVAAVLREYARQVADPTELADAIASLDAHLAADPSALFDYPSDVASFLANVQSDMIAGVASGSASSVSSSSSMSSSLNTLTDGDGAADDMVSVTADTLDSAEGSGTFTFTNEGFRWVAIYADPDDASTSITADGDSRWVTLLPARSYDIPGATDLAADAITVFGSSLLSLLPGATGDELTIQERIQEQLDDYSAAPEDYTATFGSGELDPLRTGRFQVAGGGGGSGGSDPGARDALPMALDIFTTIGLPIIEIAVDVDLQGPPGSVDTTACEELAVGVSSDHSGDVTTLVSAVIGDDWTTFFDTAGDLLLDLVLDENLWNCLGISGVVTPDWVAEQVLENLASTAAVGWVDLAASLGNGVLNGFNWVTTIDGTPRGADYDLRLADRDEDGAEDDVLGGTDCDDEDAASHPGAEEACDGVDNDCDGVADDDAGETWYADADGDGWGDEAVTQRGCSAPSGYAAESGDCNDADAAFSPGATEAEDGIDNDCDGGIDEGSDSADDDADGYSEDAGDCDDADATVNPGATETRDGEDDDCDGRIDNLGAWTYEDIDTVGDVGTYASLGLDPDDDPHFACETDADTFGYYYDGTYGWTDTTVDSSTTLNLDSAEIAVDLDGYAHFLWYDTYSDDVRYAWYDASGRHTATVDSDIYGSYAYDEGHLALAVDADRETHIVFSDSVEEAIRYGSGIGGAFTLTAVSSADPTSLDLALDVSADGVGIAYIDSDADDAMFLYIDSTGSVSSSTVESSGRIDDPIALAFDDAGTPYVAYWDETDTQVHLGRWNGVAWDITTVEAPTRGWSLGDIDLAMDSTGRLHLVYGIEYSYDFTLRYATSDDEGATWTVTSIGDTDDSPQWMSLAIDSFDAPHVAYYDEADNDLVYGYYY